MKSTTRERAIRILMSAVMASDLRPNEIREISNALQKDAAFSREIGSMMKEFVRRIEVTRDEKMPKLRTGDTKLQTGFVTDALSVINRRRLSKRTVRAMIKLLIPQSPQFSVEEASSLRDTLLLFQKQASPSQANRLLSWLEPSTESAQSNVLSEALRYVEERSITKRDMVAKIGEFSPEMADLIYGDRLNTKEILGIFLDCASEKQSRRFMKWLQGDISSDGDDYLKGIMKER